MRKPDDFEANYNGAIALQAIGRRAEALKRFKIAFKLRPDNGGSITALLGSGQRVYARCPDGRPRMLRTIYGGGEVG